MEATDVMKNLISVWLVEIASLSYCYYISAKLPKGPLRLISLVPVLCILTLLPFHLCSAFATAVTSFFITWIGNFKLLLFVFDQGPIVWHKPSSLPIFITLVALPVKTKQDPNTRTPQEKKKLPLGLATEILAFAIITELVTRYKEHARSELLLVLYCFLLFLLIDILVACSASLVKALTGLELETPSDEPYLSTSLQEFWGRRWNLTVTNTLRHTVYNPVRAATEAVLGKQWAPLSGVLAAFLVSGLMHELIFYQVTRATPSWEVTCFFLIHGVCVAIESGAKRALKEKLRLPWFVSGPLTVGFVVGTGFRLFFPPLIRNGADAKVLEEFRLCVNFLNNKIRDLVILVSHTFK